ncbi:DUF4167 domain-containing protein [Bradyrhizobium sp. Cp5.3]|uniref:DUF4167 domain-containing protein n=1 Tax=Bradyrhizobium sp. Cp5.3 TaxID=443598 RepID=UPI0004085B25|nr:DUF4167 domain-containing protein [Bradyrhizobium sp. Cp5.3]
MRNGQNKQRMRNRNNNNNNRRGQNPMTRVYESNGPDIKIRGTASHIAEKYLQLARDARSSGDPVAAENYYQHAEHYFRMIAAAQEQFRQNQQQPRGEETVSEDSEDDGENFSNFGQEPGFAPQPQQQHYQRDRDGQRDHQRDNQQPYQRDQQQPREHREREHRPQQQYQPQPQPQNQPQPVVADAGSVDRLPSFITGAQPQMNGGQGGSFEGGGGERYPRRRRRPHGPRPEREAAPAGSSDDLAPGE